MLLKPFTAILPFSILRFIAFCLFIHLLSILGACTSDAEETRVIEAAQAYAKANSDVEVTLEVQAIEDNYARVLVQPANPQETDEAIMYLRKNKNTWEGIAIGTSFSPDDYKSLKIPQKIR